MTTPTGILSLPLAALRELLLESATFRGWLGGLDDAQARARVFLIETSLNPPERLAMIGHGDLSRDRRVVTPGRPFDQRADGSTLWLYFRSDVAEGVDDEAALLEFTNAVGGVWEDLEKAAGSYNPATLSIRSIELAIAPTRTEPKDQTASGDVFECTLTLTYTRQP